MLFRNILCPQQLFPSLRSPRNIMGNKVSATMCPRLPGPYAIIVKYLVLCCFKKRSCPQTWDLLQRLIVVRAKKFSIDSCHLKHGFPIFLPNKKAKLVWIRGSKESHVQINDPCWVSTLQLFRSLENNAIERSQRDTIKTCSNILGIVIGKKRLVKRTWNEPGRHHQSSLRLFVHQDGLVRLSAFLHSFFVMFLSLFSDQSRIMKLHCSRLLSCALFSGINTADFLTAGFHDWQCSAMNVGPEFADKTQRFFFLLVRLRYNPPANITLLRVGYVMRYNAQVPHTGRIKTIGNILVLKSSRRENHFKVARVEVAEFNA